MRTRGREERRQTEVSGHNLSLGVLWPKFKDPVLWPVVAHRGATRRGRTMTDQAGGPHQLVAKAQQQRE
jgi:hypothetical protein